MDKLNYPQIQTPCDISETQAEEWCSAMKKEARLTYTTKRAHAKTDAHKTVAAKKREYQERGFLERKGNSEKRLAREQKAFFARCKRQRTGTDHPVSVPRTMLTESTLGMIRREEKALRSIGLSSRDFETHSHPVHEAEEDMPQFLETVVEVQPSQVIETALLRAGVEPNPGPQRKPGSRPGKNQRAAEKRESQTINLKRFLNKGRGESCEVVEKTLHASHDSTMDALDEVFSVSSKHSSTQAESEDAPVEQGPVVRQRMTDVDVEIINDNRLPLDGIHPTAKQVVAAYAAHGTPAKVHGIAYHLEKMTQEIRTSSKRPIPVIHQSLVVGEVHSTVLKPDTGMAILDRTLLKAESARHGIARIFGEGAAANDTWMTHPIERAAHGVEHLLDMLTAPFWEEQRIEFCPHMLTEVIEDYNLKTNLDIVQTNTKSKLARLTSLPVRDAAQHSYQVGSELLVSGVAQDQLNCARVQPPQLLCDPVSYVNALNDQAQTSTISMLRSTQLGCAQVKSVLNTPLVHSLTLEQCLFCLLLLAAAAPSIFAALILALYLVMPHLVWIAITLRPLLEVLGNGYVGIFLNLILAFSTIFLISYRHGLWRMLIRCGSRILTYGLRALLILWNAARSLRR